MLRGKMSREADEAPRRSFAPLTLAFGGLAAALTATTCCALPVLLAAVGVSSASLVGIAFFAAPFQPLLLAAAGLA
ncbi:MAG: hypothetical protein ACREIB_10325, partial [Pseudomonadota bacterium]